VLVVVVVRRATEPAPGGPVRRDGLVQVVAAWTAGMGLFVLLVFGYYAAYDMVLPVGNRVLLLLAAGLLGLAAAVARWVGGERTLSATERGRRAAGPAGDRDRRGDRDRDRPGGSWCRLGSAWSCCWLRRWPG
jgi:hypothetical protein